MRARNKFEVWLRRAQGMPTGVRWRSRSLSWLFVIAVPVFLLACGGSQSSATATPPPTATSSSSQASVTPTEATTPSSGAEVGATQVGQLGTVLVNDKGFTLYVFQPDKQSAPTCTGNCAVAWPPVVLPPGQSAPTGGSNVQSSLLGTVKRADGSEQVTYNGWPLYRWTGDTKPGQATGEGLNSLGGLWYAISPQGNVVK